MSAALVSCRCGSIGNVDGIRFCAGHHRYWLNDRELSSVGKVIKTVFPTSYDGADPAVLENARVRGVLVDQYFCQYLQLKPGEEFSVGTERQDVKDRLKALIPWWERSELEVIATQEIVYSEADGIAGALDIRCSDGISEHVIDLKCVSELKPAYALQLGAYLTYSNADCVGILHSTAKGVKLVSYDADRCRWWWQHAVDWYRTMQEIQA